MVERCPYDPEPVMIGQHHCPICACVVVGHFPHGPCVERECPYYDAEAAEAFDRSYAEYVQKEQARLLARIKGCDRCAQIPDELAAEIIFNLLAVVKEQAVHRWFHTWVTALHSTPISAVEQGRGYEVLAVVRAYKDPSFS